LADEVSTRFFSIHPDGEGNPQEMAVGYTQTGILLEIAVCYTDDLDEVFHCNRVTKPFRIMYEGKK